MEVANILKNKKEGLIYGIIGNINLTTNNSNIKIVNDYRFSGNVEQYLNSFKAKASLKMVMLEEEVLKKTVFDLSVGNIKKVNLAKVLIENKKTIVFDYFENSFNAREKDEFKRLIKKLSCDINKTILIHTCDIQFIWNMCDFIIVIDENNNMTTYEKKDFIRLIKENNLDEPDIIKFTNLTRNKGLKINDYKDVLDLLKAIYRIRENKL